MPPSLAARASSLNRALLRASRYLTEPSPGGTILTNRIQLRAHGPAILLEPALARLLARDARKDDARLKRLLEHGTI